MAVFEKIGLPGHELVLFGQDQASGLRTIVAVHDTTLGPALGGVRFYPYESEEAALYDVLRLSEAMTLKNSITGLDLGGGKSVILGDFREHKTEALLEEFGKVVESLDGRYITAEDIGTTPHDMTVVGRHTQWALGRSRNVGGSGDPSPATARGLLASARAVLQHLNGSPGFHGRRIAIQGVGKVGFDYARRLSEEGAELVVTDMYPPAIERAVEDLGAKAVEPEEIYSVPCDIFAPCALGAVLNDQTIPQLRCAAVVGSANNQLHEDRHAKDLADRGILYAPDFVVNAGGVINVAVELGGYDIERAGARIDKISDTLLRVLETASDEGLQPHEAAVEMANRRIEEVRARQS
ncbi:MAG: Leu/Phe/Val dehydrogenase [Acidimicrobiia bacterium]